MTEKKPSEFEAAWDTESEPIEVKPKKVSLIKLWRYATGKSLFLVILGALIAVVTGAGMPLMSIIVGNLSESFVKMTKLRESPDSLVCPQDPSCNTTFSDIYTTEDFHNDILNQCTSFAILGAAVYIAAFIQVSCFLISGEQMIHGMRLAFFRGILHQDISWFDKNNSGTLTTKLFDNLERIKEGTGDKVGLLIQFLSQFFTGFIIAFTYDWKLTLIMMSLAPFMVISGLFMAKFMESAAENEAKDYAQAGSVAEQALTSIRTVVAFNGQKHESFWVGTSFVADGKMDPKTLFTVFFSVLMGSIALGQAGQQFAVIGTAQGAASAIFEIIDREPEIDSYSPDGIRLENTKGQIVFNNVRFSYPTRKDIKILKGISFDALPGQTVALVGSSGCGKSTIVQLLLRYYNPDSGNITIDGKILSDINIESLRNMIGVVSQEPILFNCSIEENILYGNENISHGELVAACRMANAESFISLLPNGYKTIVGERGTQLSGGQKQRIAIARALVRNPKILLLDEATSALDAESESVVQQALDKARQGRTTIVIAHRLSTIKNADKIIAMKSGQVYETGTHESLMKLRGLYYELINAQVFADVEETKVPDNRDIIRRESVVSHRSRTSTVLSARRLSAAFSLEGIGVTPNIEDDEKSVTKRLMRGLLFFSKYQKLK
uniref:Uncharacterized protein n=1 Tax=Panagrolaimus sp. PS1159 TaxID=55785 RepID=A0AC35GMP4_9BILA